MKQQQKCIAGVLALLIAQAVIAQTNEVSVINPCTVPETTAPIIPDGNVASEDELIAAQKAMKSYLAEQDDYRICLDETILKINSKEPAEESDTQTASALNDLFNESVDNSQKIAEEFNLAVRAYKARQGSN